MTNSTKESKTKATSSSGEMLERAAREDIEKMSPEELARKYAEMLASLEEARASQQASQTRVESLESDNARLRNENWELRIDPRTNLERDLLYFTHVNKEIQQMIESGQLQKYLLKEELTDDDIKELDQIPLTVTQSDLGYLSKYNEDPEISQYYGEHAGGDAILKETGAVIQSVNKEKQEIRPALNPKTKGYRVGGDEFAMVHKLKKEEAKQVASEFVLKQGTIKIEGADLPTVINCGTASLREAVEAYIKTIPVAERSEKAPEDAAKKLQEMMTNIADRRAKLAKGVERLATMTRLLATEPAKFQRNYKWLQKGAFGMTVEEFAELSKLVDEGFSERVKELVKKKLAVETKREEDQRLKERAVIVEIADREL